MAKIAAMRIKKIVFYMLLIIVAILVLFAFYSSRDKFYSPEITKYIRISLENAVSLDELVEEYSDYDNRERFVSEVKKLNNIENSGFISRKTLIVPVFKSN